MSATPSDALLLAHLAGALEPGPNAELRAEVARTPDLQRRLARLQRRVEPPTPRFRIPPPGIFGGRRPVPVFARHAAVMDITEDSPTAPHTISARPGERWRMHIARQDDPEAWMPIALERLQSGSWEVVFPEDEDDLLTLSDLPRSPEGAHLLDLAAPMVAGVHRVALVLVPADLSIDWASKGDDTRWAELQAGMADGRFAVASIHVQVRSSG